MVVDVTSANFQAEVIERSKQVPVVVDFWAEWCGPCRRLGPVLEQLAAEADGAWVLAKLDTEASPELAQQFRIQGIPAVKAFRDGQVVDEFVGALPAPQVKSWLAGLAPSEADLLVKAGLEARARGDEAQALAAFSQVVALEPDNVEALLGLAELSGQPEDVRGLLARLPPRLDGEAQRRRSALLLGLEGGGDLDALRAAVDADASDLDSRWQLAHGLAALGQHEQALELLLQVVKADRSYRDDGARKAMLEIFDVVGPRSPIADAWRSRLAMVLY